MVEPILVVMAAGMGSRYGGLKQIDAIGPNGETMLDFSLYDAYQAGFRRAVFVIKADFSAVFRDRMASQLQDWQEVHYVYQDLQDLPDGLVCPVDRQKPWGTAHAVWSARQVIDQPFAVINADDYYGAEAYRQIYQFLQQQANQADAYALVGYQLNHTLSENGTVARGLCRVDAHHHLVSIEEQTQIEAYAHGVHYFDQDEWHDVAPSTLVSMNMWGFPANFIKMIEQAFANFWQTAYQANPLKAEFYLPVVASQALQAGQATIHVLKTEAKWFGVTYAADKVPVRQAISQLIQQGVYPLLRNEEEFGNGSDN